MYIEYLKDSIIVAFFVITILLSAKSFGDGLEGKSYAREVKDGIKIKHIISILVAPCWIFMLVSNFIGFSAEDIRKDFKYTMNKKLFNTKESF